MRIGFWPANAKGSPGAHSAARATASPKTEAASTEAECGPLLRPADRQPQVFDERDRGEAFRLAPLQDRGGDIRRQIGKAENPAAVGSAGPLGLGQIGELAGAMLDQEGMV